MDGAVAYRTYIWRTVQERLTALLEPVIADLGYELLLLEFSPHKGGASLRLYIDAAEGVGLEDCEKVSREVAAVLDVEDPIRQSYRLEVSSPGLDRPLVKPEHFRRFRGEQVKVETLAPVGNRRRFRGALLEAGDRDIVLQLPEGPVTLAYADIERARLVPDFEPKTAGSGDSKSGAKKTKAKAD
jgi:ribosome maturation factor RimP